MPRWRSILAALAFGAAGSAVLAPAASAQLDEVNSKKLRDAVTINGMMQHERALQQIANMNGGTRASGTPGFEASAAYVAGRLKKAGYNVKEQEFTFPFFRKLAEPTLTVGDKSYETDNFQFSGSGEVTGPIVPAKDNLIPPPERPGSTAGCESEDFDPAPSGPAIALIQRGSCTFEQKAANAQAAGYDAVIIFNEGQTGRTALTTGTLGRIFDIPVIGLSFADGAELNAQPGVIGTVTSSTENNPEAKTKNVIATSKQGDPDQQVVVGSHLDSVTEGPGINDNGSGTSQDLEIAEEMSELGITPRRQVRFAFWGAEEAGLLGSEHWVASRTPEQVARLYANLNFDMTASPNYVRFVYDGDGSDTPDAGPPGSGQIESVFTRYYASQGLASDPTAFDGRSDYGPFIAVGIPAGGLFSGAEVLKTPEQAAVYGGTAGVAYDECYHQACDTVDNLNTKSLGEMGDAAAHATLTLARSRSGFFEDGSRVGKKGVRVKAKTGPDAVK